jgi:hypothetical protein
VLADTAVTDSALGSAEGVWQSLEEQGTASLTASSHGRPAGRPVEQAIDSLIAAGSHFRASETFGGALEGVEVPGGGHAEPAAGSCSRYALVADCGEASLARIRMEAPTVT